MSTIDSTKNGWARFWSVDLHVHTPGSSDVKETDFGTPEQIVQAAINAGLDAIAITDHNNVSWCDRMAEAARETSLIVLPGFELSTPDGHLLGVWEEGVQSSVLGDVLLKVGIPRSKFGDLTVVSGMGIVDCAREIESAGGIAIAAHIDKERGVLAQPVQTYVNQILAEPTIRAFEYVGDGAPEKVRAKLGGAPGPAMVQGSDTFDGKLGRHVLTAIGARRTWVKAARPDLVGLDYALDDPELRIRVTEPGASTHPYIEAVAIDGGFLAGTNLELSPDLNSLLGGTGAGKSLVLEAIRFALDQQVEGTVFRSIRDEVDRRLNKALGEGSEVVVTVATGGERYRVRRQFAAAGSQSVVEQEMAGDWLALQQQPTTLFPIAAFSQGEILDYARQPVGRVGLVDAHLDLSDFETRTKEGVAQLRKSAKRLIAARARIAELTDQAATVGELRERERELSALFDPEVVEQQGLWGTERGQIEKLSSQVANMAFVGPIEPDRITAIIS